MIKIFATDKVKELDQYTIQHEPISSIDLVERAATTFVHEFCRRYSKQVRIVIFAGQGNNGADALAIARLLNEESYRVETYLFNPTEHLSVECEQNKQRLLDMERIEFTEVVRDFEPPTLTDRDVVIDGLFGQLHGRKSIQDLVKFLCMELLQLSLTSNVTMLLKITRSACES